MAYDLTRRPRVAAVGLNETQMASITHLCGTLRPTDTVAEYLEDYSWTETDVTILGGGSSPVEVHGNVLILEPLQVFWAGHDDPFEPGWPRLTAITASTEREVQVTETGTEGFQHPTTTLAKELRRAEDPPPVWRTDGVSQDSKWTLIETTSGWPVAMICAYSHRPDSDDGWEAMALVLPREAELSTWLREMLIMLNGVDPVRVPQAPPELSNPADWYTPQERALARQLAEIAEEEERLSAKRERIEVDLTAAGEEADAGIRRCFWADGDELVDAVDHMLTDLGFVVRNMDSERQQGEPKREDLRLTATGNDGWEAIVEVKGYPNGTKTSDARQIREYRERYLTEEGRLPSSTWWIANTYRTIADPAARPAPDNAVAETAVNIDVVHVLTTDLYRLWTLTSAEDLEHEHARQQLIDATPGLWSLPALDAGTPANSSALPAVGQ